MSKIEVNAIEPQCGTTLTLGASGDTVTLASGASQSGFGRSGTVDWQTSIKTGDFTATSGEGYFVNTTSGVVTMTLPSSPSVGDIVAVKDYAQTFDTNKLTIGRNSQPIEGGAFDLELTTEGIAITLVYGDATKGWQSVSSNEVTNAASFITATGGTITTSGDFKIHTFTGPGTFCVSNAGNAGGSNTVDYLVVAGAGGGGVTYGGGGGAGGYRESGGTASGCYTVSPLGSSPSPVAALPVTVQGYPITVGGGGGSAATGSNSIFSSITSAGGGRGAPGASAGENGGSGSGGGGINQAGGSGNTPPVTPPQGSNGGAGKDIASCTAAGGGGGGATAVGTPAQTADQGGPGGAGATSSINATPTTRAGGGGGGQGPASPRPGGTGGSGGGGAGSKGAVNGTNGTSNTGGGGGGTGQGATGGSGGSGIVIIRYKFQ
jgi:hypothetical protein